MLSRIGYVLRETAASLKRNLTLTIASLLTVVVASTLGGASLLAQRAVGNQLVRWKNNVEVSVFMNPDASNDQVQAVTNALNESALVKKAIFVDKAEALKELERLYPTTPEIYKSVAPEDLPVSFRVVPTANDTTTINGVKGQFRTKPGVLTVTSADEAIAVVRSVTGFLRVGFNVLSFVLLVIAGLLIWNTIRTAMFARRREIEVMKLVGATNWFIRWPFVLEGMVLGILGGGAACGLMFGGNRFWRARIIKPYLKTNPDIATLQVSNGQFRFACIVVLALGVIVGAVASAIAATRFLDV